MICNRPLPLDMEKNFKAQTIVNASGVNAVPVPPLTYNIEAKTGKITEKKCLCIDCATVAFLKLNELLQAGAIKIIMPREPSAPGIVIPS